MSSHIRHVLACLHYNENLKRMTKRTKEGKIYTKVSYPKYKLGEEVVREVKVQPTYSKCNHQNITVLFVFDLITGAYLYVFIEYVEDLTAILLSTT